MEENYSLKNVTTHITRLAVILWLLGGLETQAAPQIIDLTGSDGQGYHALIGWNQETAEPNSAESGSKAFDYPYYDSTTVTGAHWVMMVEPYTTLLSYPGDFPTLLHPTGPSTNDAVTGFVDGLTSDADFSDFDIGEIGYDDALLTGVGTEILGIGQFTLTLDASDFEPNTSRSPLNEFPFTFSLAASNFAGTGLTFTDGVLTSIDFTADVDLSGLLFGSNPLPVWDGTLSFSGGSFVFDLDDTEDLAPIAFNVRSYLNRSGTVVPEPGSVLLVLLGGLAFRLSRKRSGS